jgi:hypothetical protein
MRRRPAAGEPHALSLFHFLFGLEGYPGTGLLGTGLLGTGLLGTGLL